jgi:hypothetical protein
MSVVDTDGVELMTDMEQKAEIDSLDALHAKRRQLLPEYSALKALHGQNGKYDLRRKNRLEAAKIQARMDMEKEGAKITEAAVDARAHTDAGYEKFIEDGITAGTRFIVVENDMNEINERIENRLSMLYAYGREVGMQK